MHSVKIYGPYGPQGPWAHKTTLFKKTSLLAPVCFQTTFWDFGHVKTYFGEIINTHEIQWFVLNMEKMRIAILRREH